MTPTTELEKPGGQQGEHKQTGGARSEEWGQGPIGRLDLGDLVVRTIVERNGSHRDHCHIDEAGDPERQQYLAIGHDERPCAALRAFAKGKRACVKPE